MTTTSLPYSVSTGSAFNAYDKLQGSMNYVFWRTNVRTTLITLRQWGIIDGTVVAPVPQDAANPTAAETQAADDWLVRETAAYAEVIFRIADSIRATIDEDIGPKALWDALEKHFSKKQDGLRQALVAKMQTARWDGKGPISAHRDFMVGLRTQIAQTGRKMPDENFFDYFVASLPKSLDVFISVYEDTTFDVDLLCTKFSRYELHQQARDVVDGKADDSAIALFGQQAGSGSGSRRGNRDLSNVTCFSCGNKGHLRRNCPDRTKSGHDSTKPDGTTAGANKPDANGSSSGNSKADASAGEKMQSGTLYTAMAHVATGNSANLFYIDSGASDHIIQTRDGLHAYRSFDCPVEIAAANSSKILAYGSGNLHVSTSVNGQQREVVLEDVYYALDIRVQLLSLGKLEGQGWDIRLRKGGMELRDRVGNMFAYVLKVNNVYPVKLKVVPPSISLVAWSGSDPTFDDLAHRLERVVMSATAKGGSGTEASLITWHRRLGHPSFKSVVELARGSATGIIITDLQAGVPGLDACAACVAAKSVHFPHKDGRARAVEYLERVHVDIVGPMPVQSAGGKEYVYVVVDDFSRAVYTQPLHLKSEAVTAFKVFRAAAELESGKRLREVMTDNAGELSMGEMRELCEQEGIKLHTSVPYHPVSNGVAERTIGILTNIVRAMLHDCSLLRSLWAEAFKTATYVRNRTPTKALGGRTPFELVYGMIPNVSHLHAFSTPCAAVEPAAKLKKLDDRAGRYFFIGYKYGGGGYRLWDPRRRAVVESRDVLFFENGLPAPTLKEAATPATSTASDVSYSVDSPAQVPDNNASLPPAPAPILISSPASAATLALAPAIPGSVATLPLASSQST